MSRKSMSRYEGTTLEGSKGLVVAAVLAAVALALAVAQWFLLPDQVITQFTISGGANYAPKWLPLLISAGLGVGGAVWLAASRAKLGLLVAVIGVVLAVGNLVVNMLA